MVTSDHLPNVDQTNSIAEIVRARMRRAPYFVMRQVDGFCDAGVLILRGRVPSEFHRQFAQEIVADLEGISAIVNEVEVVTPPQWDLVAPGVWRKPRIRPPA